MPTASLEIREENPKLSSRISKLVDTSVDQLQTQVDNQRFPPHIPRDLIEALRRFLVGARQIVSFNKAILFGSQARGDAAPDSDVDVALIVYDLQGDIMDISKQLAFYSFDFLMESKYVISPVLIRGEDWDNPNEFSNQGLLENIRDEGIFYEPTRN